MKKLLFILALALAVPTTARADLLCVAMEDRNGWLQCVDQASGALYDCMKFTPTGQPLCIAHQDWHDHPFS